MPRTLGAALLAVAEQAIALAVLLLLTVQATVVGVNAGMPACVALCLSSIPTYLGAIAVHELGHLLAGRAVGLRVTRLVVGPLAVAWDGGRRSVRLNTDWWRPAAYVARDPEHPAVERWRVITWVTGGPLANLAIGAVCLATAAGANPGPPADVPRAARGGWREVALLYPGDPLTAWLNGAGLVSVALGVLNLIPSGAAGRRTDGGLLADVCRGEAA